MEGILQGNFKGGQAEERAGSEENMNATDTANSCEVRNETLHKSIIGK